VDNPKTAEKAPKNPRLRHLRVKVKSLAAESRCIRCEEKKLLTRTKLEKQWRRAVKKANKDGSDIPDPPTFRQLSPERREERGREALVLQDHRRGIVRNEARCAILAYGFLRGRPYASMEEKVYERPNWYKVYNNAKEFTNEDIEVIAERFLNWLKEADSWSAKYFKP